MKRSPLRRKKPLTRKAWRRKKPTAYMSRPRDTPYMMWVKRQPCAARAFAHVSPCYGRVDPDHAGRRPYGRKAPDRTCIPMCRRHHRERDAFAGAFRDWDHDRMRRWLDFQIVSHEAAYQLQGGTKGGRRRRGCDERWTVRPTGDDAGVVSGNAREDDGDG